MSFKEGPELLTEDRVYGRSRQYFGVFEFPVTDALGSLTSKKYGKPKIEKEKGAACTMKVGNTYVNVPRWENKCLITRWTYYISSGKIAKQSREYRSK